MGRVNFKLWGKLEVSEDEQALINRYRFDESVLIGSDDSELLRKAIKLGAGVFVVAALLFTYMLSSGTLGFLGGIAAGGGAGYWLMNEPVANRIAFTRELLGLIAAGSLKIEITEFPLEQARAAHEAIEGRKTTGKVVLTVG